MSSLEAIDTAAHIPAYAANIGEAVCVSEAAVAQLRALLADENEALGVRIFVSGGGCSGMNYSMSFAMERLEQDALWQHDTLQIYIDPIALSYLNGVEIDYQNDDFGGNFVFKNAFQAIGGSGACGGCAAAGG